MIGQLAKTLLEHLRRHGEVLVTAESCTGGWIAKSITDCPGSSSVFDRGYVTYSNEAKQQMLGVQPSTLEHHGAVSEQTVSEMVRGALQQGSGTLAVAVSGIAGPGGGTPDKPVGSVWFAWRHGNQSVTRYCRFEGERDAVRRQAVETAIQGLIELLQPE